MACWQPATSSLASLPSRKRAVLDSFLYVVAVAPRPVRRCRPPLQRKCANTGLEAWATARKPRQIHHRQIARQKHDHSTRLHAGQPLDPRRGPSVSALARSLPDACDPVTLTGGPSRPAKRAHPAEHGIRAPAWPWPQCPNERRRGPRAAGALCMDSSDNGRSVDAKAQCLGEGRPKNPSFCGTSLCGTIQLYGIVESCGAGPHLTCRGAPAPLPWPARSPCPAEAAQSGRARTTLHDMFAWCDANATHRRPGPTTASALCRRSARTPRCCWPGAGRRRRRGCGCGRS